MPVKAAISAAHQGQKVRVGIRPEYFQPGDGTMIAGKVSFIEVQGRETLYDVSLPDKSILRSIQGSHLPIKIGDEVKWGIDSTYMLVFDQDGSLI